MNNKFDELTKDLAQSVTRRGALKKFGIGFAGFALAALGLATTNARSAPPIKCNCKKPYYGCLHYPDRYDACIFLCSSLCAP